MANLNKVMIIGNCTRDPSVQYTPKGTAVTELGLAINRHYTTDAGEKREETTFVDVTFFGRQAEIAGQYLTKGKPVFVEGRLSLDSWEDKETRQKRSKLKVIGEVMQFLGSSERQEDAPRERQRDAETARRPPPARSGSRPPARDYDGDDIPF